MQKWKIFVRLHDDGKYQLVRHDGMPGKYGRQTQIDITGSAEPEIPDGVLSRGEYLRWQADLADKGYKVLNPFGI